MNPDKQRITIAECIVFIPLTQGFIATADFVDFDAKLRDFHWRVKRNGRTNYAVSDTKGYRAWMHREVLGVSQLVQHLDDNGLNNCRYNLLASCDLHNQQIKRKQLNRTSRYKGVSRYSRDGKWQAGIRINGHSTALGMFTMEEDAARAYDAAAIKYFGKFARLNFP